MLTRIQSVVVLLATLLPSFATSAAATKNQLYQVGAGPLPIAMVESFELEDQRRGKTLPLRMTFPKQRGKFPVIVFSHGAMGSKDAYAPLVAHWASHGYVCIQPTHEDSLQLMLKSGERFRSQNVWAKWNTRPPDIKLILDSLGQLEEEEQNRTG